MVGITEEYLRGEWFHLEEEEPLNLANSRYYLLGNGEVRWNTSPDIVGRYFIQNDVAVITFLRKIPFTVTVTLRRANLDDAGKGDRLNADATYRMPDGSDPHIVYGLFVRRIANYLSTDAVRTRTG